MVKPKIIPGTYGQRQPEEQKQPALPGMDAWQSREQRPHRGMTAEQQEIESMVSDVEACSLDLSDWELKFIVSIRGQWNSRRTLSPAQEKTLRKIHEEKT